MLNNEQRSPDDTLQNMITNLKPNLKSDLMAFDDYESSLKRSISSSGLFDYVTPAKKAKRDSFEYIASPSEARKLKADLLEAKNTIMSLENRIQSLHNGRKEMQIMFDNELRSLERQHNHDNKTIKELEVQLQKIKKREAEVKSELSEVKFQY